MIFDLSIKAQFALNVFVYLNTFLICSLVQNLEKIVKVKLLLKKTKKMTCDKN
jgi:hypothetical protein